MAGVITGAEDAPDFAVRYWAALSHALAGEPPGSARALGDLADAARIGPIELSAVHHAGLAAQAPPNATEPAALLRAAGLLSDVLAAMTRAPDADAALRSALAERKAELADLEAELVTRAALARQADGDLADLTYALSHSLKSPVNTAMMALADLRLDHGDLLPADADETLVVAETTMERMRALVDGLMQLGRTASAPHRPRPVALTPLVGEVLAAMDPALTESGAEVRLDTLPTLPGDAEALRTLFRHLIDNALRYRARDRALCLRIGPHPAPRGIATERVAATGDGIAPEHCGRIFALFERLHSHDMIPGSGIGLTLCKRISMKHGGGIQVDSRPGVGTRFDVTLSLRSGVA